MPDNAYRPVTDDGMALLFHGQVFDELIGDLSLIQALGHITGDGPATVRMLLCEAAWQAVRRSPSVKAFFERVSHGDPGRKKVALVAVAHKLARAMAAMLRSGEAWREQDPERE